MLVTKLRIFALLMRLQELDQERLDKNFRAKFLNERIMITRIPLPKINEVIPLYNKKGKPFDPSKSKYHK
jgi:hypothetical protein